MENLEENQKKVSNLEKKKILRIRLKYYFPSMGLGLVTTFWGELLS